MWTQVGVITGWNVTQKRQVHLGVVLGLPSGPLQTITRPSYPKHLKLKAEANAGHAAPEEAPGNGAPSSVSSRPSTQVPEWALDDYEPGMVGMESKCKALLADKD